MRGVMVLAGMGLQIPAGRIVISLGSDGSHQMTAGQPLLRLDLWPTWLEIGCRHADQARAAADRLVAGLSDDEKNQILTEELQAGLVALTAFAFAVDGFYDTLCQERGTHPDQAAWKKNRTARDAQVTETLRFHLKVGPHFAKQLRTVIKELFRFRGRAVHPSSKYVELDYRPEVDSLVHPHLLTFSGPHVVQARALILDLLDRLVARAADTMRRGDDLGWIERGQQELQRLSVAYRVTGDDQLAYPPPAASGIAGEPPGDVATTTEPYEHTAPCTSGPPLQAPTP